MFDSALAREFAVTVADLGTPGSSFPDDRDLSIQHATCTGRVVVSVTWEIRNPQSDGRNHHCLDPSGLTW